MVEPSKIDEPTKTRQAVDSYLDPRTKHHTPQKKNTYLRALSAPCAGPFAPRPSSPPWPRASRLSGRKNVPGRPASGSGCPSSCRPRRRRHRRRRCLHRLPVSRRGKGSEFPHDQHQEGVLISIYIVCFGGTSVFIVGKRKTAHTRGDRASCSPPK